ncbi:MAG: ATP-dependent helicase [Phycisphaerales bacterium JB037]
MTFGRPDADQLLADLTDDQRHAVEHTEGPLLVLAAAGSGKTRVITRRIARLVSLGVPPWSILALTFTNKAAGEMRERVHGLLSADPRLLRGMTITTFHSLCARLLRRYAGSKGVEHLPADFTIYDSSDQASLMKRTIADLGLSTSNWPPRSVLSTISNAKNELQDAAAYKAAASDYYANQIAKIYEAYERGLRAAGAIDFDDLLLLTAGMLRADEGVRAEIQHRWHYLLIDEYQDTNRAQFLIASLIAGEGRGLPGIEGTETGPNICVVGDPDQSIYGWRGADISNILEFEEHYPGARVIALGENFRSTAPILANADTLIRHNKRRKHKDLYTRLEGGDPVEVTLCADERREAQLVCDWLRARREDDRGLRWSDMAVFYRNNALSRVMEDALREHGIPYVIARGTAFYEREEIKDALAYLRVVANPRDEVSLARIVNKPTRGLGKASLDKLAGAARSRGVPMLEMLRDASGVDGVSPRAQSAAAKFVAMIDGLTGSGTFMGAEVSHSLPDLVERVIRDTGLEASYEAQAAASKSEADAERLDNLSELVSSAAQFEERFVPEDDPASFPGAEVLAEGKNAETPPLLAMLRAFLESVALVADADKVDPAQGAVTLMTLHAAKGLEFPAVAMVGLEEGLLPSSRAMDSEDSLEEERRLCFVGITRAMRRLHISSARYRTVRGMTERTIPSRFLEELDSSNIRASDQSDFGDAFGGGVGGGFDRDWSGDSSAAGGVSWDAPESVSSDSSRAAASAKVQFPPGCRVRHPRFGMGTVVSVGGGQMAKVRVKFQQAGEKTLILEYARLQRL